MAEAFARPLGLFLQGGGALGAWQIGVLAELSRAGARFDAVMGYSIGAVNGVAVAYDRMDEALSRWASLGAGILRPRPRLNPPSLFSDAPLYGVLDVLGSETRARAALRVPLTIISAAPAQGAPINALFEPGERGRWDAPIAAHLAASCSIPLVFPPVELDYRGRRVRLIDGGVPQSRGFDLSPLAHCAEILSLEMVRADETDLPALSPWRLIDRSGRRAQRRLADEAFAALARGGTRARVRRWTPSRRLEPLVLDFRRAGLDALTALGREDARALLAAASAAPG